MRKELKKIRIIYNPSSGRQIAQGKLEQIAKILLDEGYVVSKFATSKKNDAYEETKKTAAENWDIIIASGGDGTLNEVASGIADSGSKIPVAILPSGTVNDFAAYMSLTNNVDKFCRMIKSGKTKTVDLGKVNDKYFVNVAAGGFLTEIAHEVPGDMKTIFGSMAYYLEGLKRLAVNTLKTFKAEIISDEFNGNEEILMFMISNTSSIGGFKNLAPTATAEDGLLDCLLFRKCDIQDLIGIFMEIQSGEHINNPNVIYFKTKSITINTNDRITLDLDGEHAGTLPAEIKIEPQIFKILVP